MENISITQVCKSMRASGMPKRREHILEDAITKQLTSSGPDFVISRMKELQSWRLKQMSGDTDGSPSWMAKSVKNGATRPKGAYSTLWTKKDKTFFSWTGAIINSFENRELTQSQINKWKDGVRNSVPSSQDCSRFMIPLSKKGKSLLNDRIHKTWSDRDFFGVGDVTGSAIPALTFTHHVKRSDTNRNMPDLQSLTQGYLLSLKTAPAEPGELLMQISLLLSKDEDRDQDKLDSWMTAGQQIRDHGLDLMIEEDEVYDEESYQRAIEWTTPRTPADRQVVGEISFLQKPGNKLRAVANPNRFVQWMQIPFGKNLQNMIRSWPNNYVSDQDAGKEWVQSQLREGKTLYSYDLSAATDTLDFSKGLNAIFGETKDYPYLDLSVDSFKTMSQNLWRVPDEYQDKIDSDFINWSVGQPLGLRPSFPFLTLMNYSVASAAAERAGLPRKGQFAIVGDDIVCTEDIAPYYEEGIEAFGGDLNHDKTVSSNRVAEFAGSIITETSIFPKKPRHIDTDEGYFSNRTKFGSKVPAPKAYLRKLADDVSQYAIAEWQSPINMPSAESLPFKTRIAANIYANIMLRQKVDPEPEQFNNSMLLDHTLSELSRDSDFLTKADHERYINILSDEYEAQKATWPETLDNYGDYTPYARRALTSVIDTVGTRMSFQTSIPGAFRYDYKSDQYQNATSVINSIKKMDKVFQQWNSKSSSDDDKELFLVSSSCHGQQVSLPTDVLIDVDTGEVVLTTQGESYQYDLDPEIRDKIILNRVDEVKSFVNNKGKPYGLSANQHSNDPQK